MWIFFILLSATIGTYTFHRIAGTESYHWAELGGQFAIAFLIGWGVVLIGNHLGTYDTEFWGDRLETIVFEGRYEDWEWNPCCREYECNCSTDKDGKETCQTCCDGCYECNRYGPYFKKVGVSNETYSINKDEYYRVLKSLGHSTDQPDATRTAARARRITHSGSCNRDDGIKSADWPGTIETVENIVTTHQYQNKIRFSNSTYGFEKPSETFAKEHGLIEYNKVRNHYQPDVHGAMGPKLPGYKEACRQLAFINGTYGKAKQLKMLIMVVPYSQDVLFWQKQYLEGGNKNEFIIALAIDSTGKIKDSEVISWTDSFASINGVETWLGTYTGNNLSEIVEHSQSIVLDTWKRREFTQLNEFVTMEPNWWIMLIAIILQTGAGYGLFRLFSENYLGEGDNLRF